MGEEGKADSNDNRKTFKHHPRRSKEGGEASLKASKDGKKNQQELVDMEVDDLKRMKVGKAAGELACL